MCAVDGFEVPGKKERGSKKELRDIQVRWEGISCDEAMKARCKRAKKMDSAGSCVN
jgi:hypothetical protein